MTEENIVKTGPLSRYLKRGEKIAGSGLYLKLGGKYIGEIGATGGLHDPIKLADGTSIHPSHFRRFFVGKKQEEKIEVEVEGETKELEEYVYNASITGRDESGAIYCDNCESKMSPDCVVFVGKDEKGNEYVFEKLECGEDYAENNLFDINITSIAEMIYKGNFIDYSAGAE